MPTTRSSSSPRFSVAAYQFTPRYGDLEGNREHMSAALAPRAGAADLVVLPELVTSGYTFGSREEAVRLSEPADGPTAAVFAALAAVTGSTYVYGFPEAVSGGVFNSAAVVGPKGLIGVYRKVHLFDQETKWFDPGDQGFQVFDIGGVPVGVMICFDWFYPESMRTLALQGAAVVAHPSNLVLPWCQRSMPVRCLENHVAAITCNREGRENRGGFDYTFTGGSVVCGYTGEALARATRPGDQWLQVTLDVGRAADRRMGAIADLLAHRRPDAYTVTSRTGETS